MWAAKQKVKVTLKSEGVVWVVRGGTVCPSDRDNNRDDALGVGWGCGTTRNVVARAHGAEGNAQQRVKLTRPRKGNKLAASATFRTWQGERERKWEREAERKWELSLERMRE